MVPALGRIRFFTLLVLYPLNPNDPPALEICFVNPLHTERLAFESVLRSFSNHDFNARLNETNGLEQIGGNCGK